MLPTLRPGLPSRLHARRVGSCTPGMWQRRFLSPSRRSPSRLENCSRTADSPRMPPRRLADRESRGWFQRGLRLLPRSAALGTPSHGRTRLHPRDLRAPNTRSFGTPRGPATQDAHRAPRVPTRPPRSADRSYPAHGGRAASCRGRLGGGRRYGALLFLPRVAEHSAVVEVMCTLSGQHGDNVGGLLCRMPSRGHPQTARCRQPLRG